MAFKKGQVVIAVANQESTKGSRLIKNDEYVVDRLEPIDLGIKCKHCGNTESFVYVTSNSAAWCFCDFRPPQSLYRSVGISKELAKSFTETLETSEVIKTEKLKENA